MRAIFIAVDLTRPMQMRDLKPSRLAATIAAVRAMAVATRQQTPVVLFCLAGVHQQACQVVAPFTHDLAVVLDALDSLKVAAEAGYFSLERTLAACLAQFEAVPLEYHRELVLVQGSPGTKDARSVLEAIDTFREARVRVSIASMVGWVSVFRRLQLLCAGTYATLETAGQLSAFLESLAEPPSLTSVATPDSLRAAEAGSESGSQAPEARRWRTRQALVKVGLCRSECDDAGRVCFCHMRAVTEFTVCKSCLAVVCHEPPLQCGICGTLLVLPTDLFRGANVGSSREQPSA